MMYRTLLIGMVALVLSTKVQAQLVRNIHGNSNLSLYLNEKKWDQLFPNRYQKKQRDFYSFKAFLDAAKHFPSFLSEGNATTRKRELAAFLANIAQETSGGWETAPGGYFVWGLYFLQENGCDKGCPQYSDTSNRMYPPVPGKSYHGRGPKQLSWNYNYGQFSKAYFGDKNVLLNDPDILASDPKVSFASAIWFWMAPQPPKPSCHDIMTGEWLPTATDSMKGRLPGFGATVNVINGGVECGIPEQARTKFRYDYYKHFCSYFNVSPGDNIECTTQKPFNQ